MKRVLSIITLILTINCIEARKMPEKKTVIACMEKVNDRFMSCHNPADDSIRGTRSFPTNVWTRSVYLEGLMALHSVSPQPRYTEYALVWAETNRWGFYGGANTLKANNQCCAQVYIDLYRMYGNPKALSNVERLFNNVVNNVACDDWDEINAIQTAMPAIARTGAEKKDMRYFEKMMELYFHLRNGIGLYNPIDGMWWQNESYMPTYKEPNGQNCYRSRGNGWVLAGLARTIDEIDTALPDFSDEEHEKLQSMRVSLVKDFINAAMVIKDCQREDGFWNCSLTDPHHYGGPESSGTSLFVYGMAWGIRKQLLSADVFLPVVMKGWEGLTEKAVHPDGAIGYIQGIGKEPKDGQPIEYAERQDGNDFGTGCFLLAGSEITKLLSR